MNYFKKFSEICCTFAIFSAVIFIFRSFMEFSSEEELSLIEKTKAFFSPSAIKDHRTYLILIFLLIFSLAVSLLADRFTHISPIAFSLSLFPLIEVFSMYSNGKLYEFPMLYFFMCGIHVIGRFFDCVSADRTEKHSYATAATELVAFIFILFSAYIFIRGGYAPLSDENSLSSFDKEIYIGFSSGAEKSVYLTLSIMYASALALGFVLRGIHFIHSLAAFVPLVYAIYLYNVEKLDIHAPVILLLSVIYAAVRLAVTIAPSEETSQKGDADISPKDDL